MWLLLLFGIICASIVFVIAKKFVTLQRLYCCRYLLEEFCRIRESVSLEWHIKWIMNSVILIMLVIYWQYMNIFHVKIFASKHIENQKNAVWKFRRAMEIQSKTTHSIELWVTAYQAVPQHILCYSNAYIWIYFHILIIIIFI